MGTVLVTGVGGFIGAELARQLSALGHDVIGVDDFSLGHARNVPSEIEFIEADLSQSRFIDKLGERSLDIVYHLAGQSGGELSFSDPLFDLDANVRSTQVLIQLMMRSGCRRIVYASSVAVYGDAPFKEGGLVEGQELRPTSPYGISKHSSEEYLRVLSGYLGLKSASLRLFNVYGPGQDLERMNQGMLSIYLGQALSAGRVEVKGSLDRFRDFVHVSDAAAAFIAAGDALTNANTVFNVCSGRRTHVSDALELLQASFEGQLEIEVSGSTPGDVSGWVGNPSKIMSETNWRPATAFEDGFSQMIALEKKRWSE